ncbi:hypothetical protein [Candidatus Endomicrobiellum trichonymphae]|uniref:hypothetical protein n=1 Tax=Endomicrobium trichonymphae TaxID=1408204 RepID=UPI000325F793|nr:hypothetical protein [Candidatus Endomicrobium trichonymphae]
MKKLIAGLMMLLMFVNVASAVKGVAPDAKTLAQLKDMGMKHLEILCSIEVPSYSTKGFSMNTEGEKMATFVDLTQD